MDEREEMEREDRRWASVQAVVVDGDGKLAHQMTSEARSASVSPFWNANTATNAI